MYLDCFKNNGKPYLRIVENYTETVDGVKKKKRKTIKNLGPLSNFDDGKPDVIKRMRQQLVNGELIIDNINPCDFKVREKISNIWSDIDNNEFEVYLNPKNIGYFFLENEYNKLGISELLTRIKSDSKIKYDLNGLTKLLVFNRILDPKSKKGAFENKNKYLFPVTSCEDINDVYKVLDVLDDNAKSIQLRMNSKIKKSSIGRKTELTYYDCTNYYFETMYGDEDIYETNDNGEIIKDENGNPILLKKTLRKKGVSKEHRPEPIVQMGLFLDNNGLPVSFGIYPGNTQDKTTFTDMIKNSINNSGLGRIVVVADNGMNTQENLYLLKEKNNGYIVSKSVKKCWKSYKNWIQNDEGYTKLNYGSNEVIFKYKSRIIERTLTFIDKETKQKHSMTVKEKEIVYWSKKHYEKELYQNQKFIEYLESCKENPDKLKDKQRKSQEFIKVIQVDKKTGEIVKTKQIVTFLNEKLEKYKETMGYYMIITSEIDEDEKDIINRYHGLSRIEDSFRITKSTLETRPVFVRTNEHINAHFLICFIALTIIRILQYKVLKSQNKETLNVDGWEQGITADKLKETLNQFNVDKKNSVYYKSTKPNEYINLLEKAYNVDCDLKLPTEQDIRNLKNKLYTSK